MILNRFKRIFCMVGFGLLAVGAHAQMKGWELGGWAGVSNYFGDLNTNWRVNRLHFAYGGGARYNFNDRLAVKLSVGAGRVSADDADSKNIFENRRNLRFTSPIIDGAFVFEFNFLPYIHGHREFFFTPFVFAGPAFFYFNPQAEYDGRTYNLRELGTEGQFKGEEYGLTQGALAYGLGFKADLSYRWSVVAELSGRKLFTDYLDDVSKTYADPRDIRTLRGEAAVALADPSVEPKIGGPGRQRGNGKNNDMYAFLSVGLYYYFGYIRCPAFMR